MALTSAEAKELETRKGQLAARLRPDGTAAKGFRKNVAALKARIAELEARQ